MTEAQLHVFTLKVPCPNCSQTDEQIISDLMSNQIVSCHFCGGSIDVSSDEWRTRISEAAEDTRMMYIPKI